MAKLSFLAGFGAGYVLGARAGRERYEQIRRAWGNAKDDPRLQSVAGMAQARADGSIRSGAANDDFVARSPSSMSREQVREELRAARVSGELAAISAEAYSYAPLPATVFAKAAEAPTRP